MIDLYPRLYLLFPTPEAAYVFARRLDRAIKPDVTAEAHGCRVEVDGADHPELRMDIIGAAKTLGGDEVPAPSRLS